MRSFPALILLFGFLWTQFYNTAVISVYEITKSEYIQAFCENQDKPELKCNGKCHLSKQLVETQKEPKQNEPPTLLPVQELFVYQLDVVLPLVDKSKQSFSNPIDLYDFENLDGLDRPPRA